MHRVNAADFVDQCIILFDNSLKALFPCLLPQFSVSGALESEKQEEHPMSTADRRYASALMRINYTGEVCAQALYTGQFVFARSHVLRGWLVQAACEEGVHLRWCYDRIVELGGRTSFLDPLWFTGSFVLGTIVSMAGDRWSLGFIAETERQVVEHLVGHIQKLEIRDPRSVCILRKMCADEQQHQDTAWQRGGYHLPEPMGWLMQQLSQGMIQIAYYI